MGATPSGFQDSQDSQNLFQDSQNFARMILGPEQTMPGFFNRVGPKIGPGNVLRHEFFI